MDDVMGGVSVAEIEKTETVTFKGQLSLENNGGFASFNGQIGNACACHNAIRWTARTNTPGRDVSRTT